MAWRGRPVPMACRPMWVSNGGITDFYVVFARESGMTRSSRISAFVVDADSAGLEIAERIDVISAHPLALAAGPAITHAQADTPAQKTPP